MTTDIAMKALHELSEKINDYEFNQAKRTYYGLAIDTAVKGLGGTKTLKVGIQTFHASTYTRVCQICEEIKDLAGNYGNESEVKLLANEIVELMDFNRMMKMHLKHAKEEAEEDKQSE